MNTVLISRIRRFLFYVASLFSLIAGVCLSALAGEVGSPCDHPSIFEGPGVNVVVLPYSAKLPQGMAHTSLGSALALLIQMHSLSSIMGYGPVGAVQLVPNSPTDFAKCEAEAVWSRISQMHAGGLVMIWGRIYEDSDQVYIQSYARFIRHSGPEILRLEGTEWALYGRLSTQTVSFPSRIVTQKDLDAIADNYLRYRQLRKSPSDDSSTPELYQETTCRTCILRDKLRFSYYVEHQEGDWAEVRTSDGKTGWIRLRAPLAGRALDDLMPELRFTNALVGYLQVKLSSERKTPLPAGIEFVENSFRAYQIASEASPADSALAVANELLGFLALPDKNMQPAPSVDQVAMAFADFQAALRVAPTDAEAMNLAAITKFYEALVKGGQFSAVETSDNLLGAAVSDTNKGPALGNLKIFYELARSGRFSLGDKHAQATDQLSSEYVRNQLALINDLAK